MGRRILIVEERTSLCRSLRDRLSGAGFSVSCTSNAAAAREVAAEWQPDIVLIDVTLPDGDGFELLEQLRQPGVGVIFIASRGQRAERIRGLQLGDDCITRPFDPEELIARVHAVLRRACLGADRLILGPVVVDFKAQVATRCGQPIHLTHREFELLRHLSRRRDQVVHRDELLHDVWGYTESPITRSVDHAIARLRRKIEVNPHQPRFIHTVHGDGYCLTVTEQNELPAVS